MNVIVVNQKVDKDNFNITHGGRLVRNRFHTPGYDVVNIGIVEFTDEGCIMKFGIVHWSTPTSAGIDHERVLIKSADKQYFAIYIQNQKKELFICRHNPNDFCGNIGDTYSFFEKGLLNTVTLNYCEAGGDYSDCFHIIGKVSKNAIWVKEGDTFNAEELSQQGSGVNFRINGGFVLIKCKYCQTFH